MHLVRLVVQLLESLRIQEPYKAVERIVVAVGDHTENGLLSLAQPGQFQRVFIGDVLDLPQREGSQTDSSGHKNAFRRLARRLFENMVLPYGDVIWLLFLQRLKKQIQCRLIIVIVLFRPAVLDHGEHHFHGLLIRRRLMEKVEHKGGVEGNFGFFPKGIVLCGVLRRGVLNEIVDQPEHIWVLADITERVIAVGMARLNEVEHLDNISLL